MNIDKVKEKIVAIADLISENEAYLTDLDREIGDADHGYNMKKGFTKVKEAMNEDFPNLKALFNKIAMTLISTVGGASGPLYGTFFMKFAQSLGESEDIDKELFTKAFSDGVDGVIMRGKAKVGDKTMVDVLSPVADALKEDKKFSEIIDIAKENMERTKDIKAIKGRAAYLGDRSIGHIDPGACSSYLCIKSALGDLND
ncbi:dihydroxyacetone kinase subunit DhaL [Anaerococcus hydrogenalis]|uniref:phosphoenolpyruvate--glycerone phosphotransferase n=1 Tax=Anaerococcus hydrogenalis TaxID=33029 RepID=A0A2N6UKY8_9FIRM|nr:dihydroxyacetone kinase subunit DhaL [Anaerococcus hydrogenalis]MDK7694424.1 dihydroxyacetone kinase subunit DhaL [Anaerococcus hydrogenalis]MDK7696202.1 dihydroxyacetone kinase subunit DhaL [Anaerococcus hydrogenalis]MDK7707451.1 dihydroxyacetone kinase subunit DhaL [Anaerococcus hydrogenalis]PMC82466.1 dihydroxyacetone kinase subunit L [Anaerococcus hydrogenalis]